MFSTGKGGLPGNDDSGGLSSWYVWASLGLFPVAGQNLVLVNAPAFEHSSLSTSGGQMQVHTRNFVEPEPDGPVQYVQRATLDGVDLDRTWLTGSELHRGGELVLDLGDDPNPWGARARPPSTSAPHPLAPNFH